MLNFDDYKALIVLNEKFPSVFDDLKGYMMLNKESVMKQAFDFS